jgi:ABC-2 type transport system ATP-binding protein
LHDPQVLLLDEPASGLDPRARIEIRALLRELRGLGKTIMVSSHILPELADVCNKIGIIERGKLEISAEVTDVMRRVRRQPVIHVGLSGKLDDAAKTLEGHPIVEKVEIRDSHLLATLCEGTQDYSDLPALLIQAGHRLTAFKEEEINLETAFMALTKGITA